jgi:signal transduction histidine kinase
VRGYLLSGQRQFLDPYASGQADEQRIEAAIRSLLPDEPTALDRLRIVQDGATKWRRDFAQPMITARDRTADETTSEALLTQSKNAFDSIRADLAALQRTVADARSEARSALARSRDLRNLIFASIVVVFVVGLIIITVLLRLAVLRPLQRLGQVARRVAGGDFDQPLPRSGADDLVSLADDLDDMRRQIADALSRSEKAGAQLQRQTEELRRSNSDLEQFAYVASHDLQEPLRKVASFCQMLQRRYESALDERGQQYIAFAVDGATRMQVLINDLLAFSRIGRVYDSVEPVPMEVAFDRAMSDLSGRIEETGATIDRPELPVVRADPTLLAMLWVNLLGNAVKFAKEGEAPRVEIAATQTDDTWQFSVTDHGIGIEPQFQDKIFVIFQRLHPRGTYPGTGIGLAMCKRIVEFHGGRIWLDTEHHDGTRICFTSSTAAEAQDAAEDDPDTPDDAGTTPVEAATAEPDAGGTISSGAAPAAGVRESR